MIYVRTCAYNAEKTITRTIESILNQTYGEFTYYILDNGSKDGTREIIRSYAEKDSRIVPFYAERNHDITECTGFWNLFYSLQDGDYLCSLDADDSYELTFLEEMLRFVTENDLDMAACGSLFMDAETWQQCGDRVLHENIVIRDGEELGKYFPEIYWNLRQTWGKLYSAKAARMPYMIEKPEWYPKAYGGDTVNTFEAVKMSLRIGVLARPLHYYALSMKSVSNRWIEGREKSDPLLFDKAKELLIEKCGIVSERNTDFLFAVYFNALCDTFRTLFRSNIPAEQKLQIAREIFFFKHTQEMFCQKFGVANETRVAFFVDVVVSLLSLWEENKELSFEMISEIFSNINPDFSQVITKDSFAWYMDKHPIIIRNVALREYEYATNNLLVWLNKKETNPDKDFPYILGQQLAALRNEEQKYVIFSKQLIRWYIANNQLKRAEAELKEWSELLPNDVDILTLKEAYQQQLISNDAIKGKHQSEVIVHNEWDADILKKEYDFFRYVSLLKEVTNKYVIIVATRDTPWGPAFEQQKTKALKDVGYGVDLYGKYRYAYAAIMDEGRVLFEKIGTTTKDVVTHELMIDEDRISISSSGFEADVIYEFTAGSILINGEEVSARGRGLNFVIYDKMSKKVVDTVNFDTYSNQLSCRHPLEALERIQRFAEQHVGVELLCVKAPGFPKKDLTSNERFILENNVVREKVISNLEKSMFAINKYYDKNVLEEVFAVPKSYHDISGVRRFQDVRGRSVNVEGGHRITLNQPTRWNRTIYFIGGCSVFGIGASDEHTMASWLQKQLNGIIGDDVFCVQNYGYYLCEADRQREEEMDILEALPVKSGDIVLYYWTEDGISPMNGFPMIDCSAVVAQPRDCEVFIDKGHLTPDGYRLVAEKIFDELLKRGMLETTSEFMPEKKLSMSDYGFDENQNKELQEYKKSLVDFYDTVFSPKIGSIVMNCNPFTLGHRYLIEQALQRCDFLMVFLVEEDSSFFSFEDRLRLVEEGTADLPNVAIIPSGRFVISSLTFEDYFNKSELQDQVVDTSLDVVVFAREIAPCLHISKRFVGEEPFDAVTRQYNETMRRVLPEYGIEFVEIPRIKANDEAISASKVRGLLEEKDFDRIKQLVPKTTLRYLMEKYGNK
ncbi:MAG: glycosyltransferase [Lachnospiraceae bacterium]|nr:glycosyltransferase [Lachnospiraceae bacterium]